MLATGARAATYVSVSATQGMSMIRVVRDDAYLAELLFFLRAFWTAPAPPADDFFIAGNAAGVAGVVDEGRLGAPPRSAAAAAAKRRYERFLERTIQISEQSSVAHVQRPWRRSVTGSEALFFVDE